MTGESRANEQTSTSEPHSNQVGLAAIKGEKILSVLAEQFDVHANQITQWKGQLLEGAVGVFGGEARSSGRGPQDPARLY
jgi:transposase-like protein